MKRKGVSELVATVLIILITVAAVTIIWGFVIPEINKSLEPSFDATVEECRTETIINETIDEELFELHYKKRDVNQDFYDYGCPMKEKYGVSDKLCEAINERLVRLRDKGRGLLLLLRYEGEVCRDVEVEEIHKEVISRSYLENCCTQGSLGVICVSGDVNESIYPNLTVNVHTQYSTEEYNLDGKVCSEDMPMFKNISISVESLSIEWLDENTECINHCDNPNFEDFECKGNPCFVWKIGKFEVQRIK